MGAADEQRRFYRPELDLLRFIAFVAVFLHHSLPGFVLNHHSGVPLRVIEAELILKQSGSFGVCLFFLLSAYLITEILEREQNSYSKVDVKSFYKRRIARIWPLYFSFIAIAALAGMVNPSLRLESGRILAFVLLAGNWYVWKAGCSASPVAPLWSISVEEQFYLVWPWIARIGKHFMLFVCAALIPVSWITIFLLLRDPGAGSASWVNSFVQFQFFAMGAALAIILKRRAPGFGTRTRIITSLAGVLLWFIAASVCRLKSDAPAVSFLPLMLGYTLVGIGCVLVFMGFLGATVSRSSLFVYLGKISYGLYVFHMAAIQVSWKFFSDHPITALGPYMLRSAVQVVAIELTSLLLTIIAAVVSYNVLEKPFLRLKERFAVVKSRAI